MRIQMYPIKQTVHIKKEDECKVMNINFDIFLNNESFDKLDFCVKFNAEGKVVEFPPLGELNVSSPMVYVELGKAIQHALSLEGEYMKKYYDELISSDSSSEMEVRVFDI